eukprot:GILI01037429.1.p1 GENE.GILI01037429.1~~GILI01037429.1.p1  ORF type:complete len:226 (+),score=33.65 GILI01037429.1:41-679(+)
MTNMPSNHRSVLQTDSATGAVTLCSSERHYLLYKPEGGTNAKAFRPQTIAAIGPDNLTYVSNGTKYRLVGFTEDTTSKAGVRVAVIDDGDHEKRHKPKAKTVTPSPAASSSGRKDRARYGYLSSSGKRPYVRRVVPDGPNGYQKFIKLYMTANIGHNPHVTDAAAIWRSMGEVAVKMCRELDFDSDLGNLSELIRRILLADCEAEEGNLDTE